MTDRLFPQSLAVLFACAVFLIYISRYTNVDLALSNWMYNSAQRNFPWKDSWFAAVFMHTWVKYFLILIGMTVLLAVLSNSISKEKKLTDETWRRLAVVALSFISIPLIISLIKSRSIHHCPWDVNLYGGFAPYLRLFDKLPHGIRAGHCFPAGHASSGLWLAAFSVFGLNKGKFAFTLTFIAGLLPGLALGWVQQMRGAHFLSHTLWSAWIASLIILILARLLLKESEPIRTFAKN